MGFWDDMGNTIANYLSQFRRLPPADTRRLHKAICNLENAVSTLKGIHP